MSLLEECIHVKSFMIRLVFSIRRTCCITSTAESGSRNVTRDINDVNKSFIFLICDFIVAQGIAVGRGIGHVLESRAYQKTADTLCVQPAFLRLTSHRLIKHVKMWQFQVLVR
jgi:hypothetical protein